MKPRVLKCTRDIGNINFVRFRDIVVDLRADRTGIGIPIFLGISDSLFYFTGFYITVRQIIAYCGKVRGDLEYLLLIHKARREIKLFFFIIGCTDIKRDSKENSRANNKKFYTEWFFNIIEYFHIFRITYRLM